MTLSAVYLSMFWSVLFLVGPARAFAFEWSPIEIEAQSAGSAFLQPLYDYDSYLSVSRLEMRLAGGGEWFSARLTPRVRLEAPSSLGGAVEPSRSLFDMKEGWVEINQESWSVRIGNQIVSWGVSDLPSPVDVWNARDLSDPFRSLLLPQFLLKLGLHPTALDWIDLEFVLSPASTPDRLPLSTPQRSDLESEFQVSDSRWLTPTPTLVRLSDEAVVPLEYRVRGVSLSSESQIGVRMRLSRIGGWDFSLSYSQTDSLSPEFTTEVKGDANDPVLPVIVTLIPSFHRIETRGFGASGVVGEFGVRIQLAQRLALDSENLMPPENVMGSIGVDRRFSGQGIEVYLNGGFIFKTSATDSSESIAVSVPTFEPWDRNLVAKLDMKPWSSTSVGLRGIGSLVNSDGLISPYLSQVFREALTVEVGADHFFGEKKGFFGQYRDNSRVYAEVTLAL